MQTTRICFMPLKYTQKWKMLCVSYHNFKTLEMNKKNKKGEGTRREDVGEEGGKQTLGKQNWGGSGHPPQWGLWKSGKSTFCSEHRASGGGDKQKYDGVECGVRSDTQKEKVKY